MNKVIYLLVGILVVSSVSIIAIKDISQEWENKRQMALSFMNACSNKYLCEESAGWDEEHFQVLCRKGGVPSVNWNSGGHKPYNYMTCDDVCKELWNDENLTCFMAYGSTSNGIRITTGCNISSKYAPQFDYLDCVCC